MQRRKKGRADQETLKEARLASKEEGARKKKKIVWKFEEKLFL